ncbi:cytochrome c oxidase subunit 2 [Haladaptatus litoreus]|uniref:cytochrome-c oxidase n=1 Tax=Haladaptatus litoreus TaxID=553468 RepID=A0A1N7E5L1_9EURY|nr:cytochrome c oxidase subunit II [Haladaptatus litoreus]SIR83341.1 cytochrome c oxidase subunit 2 [Haladaptatus litoreus]
MLEQIRFLPLHDGVSGLIPRGTRAEVFQQIFGVFLLLGILVTVVVIGYMLYTAYRYRDGNGTHEFDPPKLGELPTESGDGRKLLFSFSLSAIIVVSLVLWTYGTLLYVEDDTSVENQDSMQVEVVGSQFNWEFVYPNGHESSTLRVPEGKTVHLTVTSTDVFHTFGVPELRVKTDAIPGQQTDTWFVADETGTYEVRCFELCGAGHSYMTADVVVMERSEYESWYESTNSPATSSTANSANDSADSSDNQTKTRAT